MHLKSGSLLQGGKYRLIQTLGQGGFGITYEAVQVALGRKVAVKEFLKLLDAVQPGPDVTAGGTKEHPFCHSER